ncbi:hypothetical protein COXBURSA334_2250 [Coxiella burnetii Q321]|nr:hypothetical protein COXBURSA334_2250 [Coxiella burnetii Q321]
MVSLSLLIAVALLLLFKCGLLRIKIFLIAGIVIKPRTSDDQTD